MASLIKNRVYTDHVCFLQYEGNIEENTKNVEVMRIKANDLDIDAINQDIEYVIVTGNEAGYFSLVMDPHTKEGILMLDKVSAHKEHILMKMYCAVIQFE